MGKINGINATCLLIQEPTLTSTRKEFTSNWLYYPMGTTISTMKGNHSLNYFGLDIPLKIGNHILPLDFVQIEDSGYEDGIGSVALDQMGSYTVAKDLVVFQCSNKKEIVPRSTNVFQTQVK